MKKLFGASLLSTMLLLGQPMMALADTTGSRIINFEEIESIMAEQNIDVQMNQNERLKAHADFSDLKRNIKDLEDDLDDINSQRDQASGNTALIIGLGAEKRALLEALKQAERGVFDQPTAEAIVDLQYSMSDDSLTRTAEIEFIGYNQVDLASIDISLAIKTLEKQLSIMQLQESLGLIAHNNMNDLKTKLVDLHTKLESTNFQKDSLERQLKNLFNDQENTLVIGSVPSANQDFIIEDKAADLKKALENSYIIKIKVQEIVMLQSDLDRAKKDHGMSSNDYKKAAYELTNANLELTLSKDKLQSDYDTMLDDFAKLQSNLRLAEQTLADKKVALSEAQVRMSLGMITQFDMDSATTDCQVQENAVRTKQIDLFNAKSSYYWFLKGMPRA